LTAQLERELSHGTFAEASFLEEREYIYSMLFALCVKQRATTYIEFPQSYKLVGYESCTVLDMTPNNWVREWYSKAEATDELPAAFGDEWKGMMTSMPSTDAEDLRGGV
jgi:hypothetical protein